MSSLLPSDRILAKGSNFLGLLRCMDARDPTARLRVLQALPPERARALGDGDIVTMGWYPIVWYAELHDAIDKVLGGGPSLARELGHDTCVYDFNSIHRVIAAMFSVETVFGQAHRLMGLYFKGGTIERLDVQPGRGRIRFIGWYGFSRLIWEDLLGAMQGILELCGASNVRCRPQGALHSAHTVDFELRWDSTR
jgi:hypothetical protein